nr:hypothetical protein [Tanacetum cinerariifolium]
MDLFNLIRALNPTKVKTRSRPRAAHEVPLLTLTANRVVEMEYSAVATDSSGVPSTIERSPLDFANEAGASNQGAAAPEVPPPEDVSAASAPEVGQAEEVAATDPSAATESHKRGRDGADVNAHAKVLRRDHADPRPTGSTRWGKSLAAIELGLASTRPVPAPENAPAGMSDPDPLSFANPQSRHPADIAQSSQGTAAAGDPKSGNASFASAVGSPNSIYRPDPTGGDGVTATPEVRARGKAAKELEAEADMKKAAEDKSAGLSQELKDMCARFSDLQVSNERLSQQVATLQEQVSGEEKLKAAFEEFKQYEDSRVEQRCAEMDALSIDFDEELYPHMLTAIAGRRWVIGRGLRFVVMKCGESIELRQAFADVVSAGIAKGMSEGLRHGVEHGQAQLILESIEAYDPEAEAKYVAALQTLKDLNIQSDTGDDAPQHIRDLRPSSSQLTIPVYPEVHDPMNPWAFKEKMLLADAIAANISRAEQKKKCRIVRRTHGVGSAHHARSDGVPVSVPNVVPHGLAILLVDATTQTELEEAI